MNIHLANMQPGVRLLLTIILIGMEFLITPLNMSGFMTAIIVVVITSVYTQYRLVHPILLHAKNNSERFKRTTFGIRVSMTFALAGIAIMLAAIFEKTPEQVSSGQNLGHKLFVLGAIFFIACAMGYNRIDEWLDEKNQEAN